MSQWSGEVEVMERLYCNSHYTDENRRSHDFKFSNCDSVKEKIFVNQKGSIDEDSCVEDQDPMKE